MAISVQFSTATSVQFSMAANSYSGVRRLGNRRSVRGGAISNRPFFGRRLATPESGGWETAAPCEEGRFPIACSSVAAWLLWSPAVGKPPLRARRGDFQSPVLRSPLGFSGVRRLGNRRSMRGGAISNRPFFGRRLATPESGGWETAAPCEEGRFPIARSSVAAWLLRSPAVGKPPLRARRGDFQSPVLRSPLGFSGVRRLGNRSSVRGAAISNRPFFGRRLASLESGGWETAAPCEEGRFPFARSSVAAWLLRSPAVGKPPLRARRGDFQSPVLWSPLGFSGVPRLGNRRSVRGGAISIRPFFGRRLASLEFGGWETAAPGDVRILRHAGSHR